MGHLEYCSNCGQLNTISHIEGRDRSHCTNCNTIHYENPKPTATLICPKDNDLLLVRRAFDPAKGMWNLPGGFMECNETLEQAGERELLEETNLCGKAVDLLGNCSHFDTMFGDVLLMGLEMKIEDWSPLQAGDDASEVGFFPLDDLPELAFICHQKIVELYRKKLEEH
jgi:ADP-ribose pyrophosphatase YjhB (NUDIX family)